MKKKVYFAIGHQPVENYIATQMADKIEVVGSTVYRENILSSVLEKEPDILITRETLPGSTDFLEIIDRIRVECSKDVQIIFITGGRHPGDAFLSALVRYQVFDLVVGDNINMKEVCRMIESPNKYRDVFMYAPKVKVDEKTKKEIFEAPTVPKVIEKEVIKEIIIDKTTVDDANSSKVSLEELKKIEEQKHQIEKEQKKLLEMKASLENEKFALEKSKIKMNEDYERRKAEFEEEMIVRLRSIENDRDALIKIEQEKLDAQMKEELSKIAKLKEEASKAINIELKQIHESKQQEVEDKIKALEEENERKIKELKDEAYQKSMEEQEKFNQIRLEEIEKFQEDKKKLERKYATLREEQERQAKLREEQENQMKHQMQLLKQEQEKLKEQKENDLRAIEEAKKQLEEERAKLLEEAEIKIKQERENLEILLKERESKINQEKNELVNEFNSLNKDILDKLNVEKAKIQKEANEEFNKYKEELKISMMKKLEEEKQNILSSSEVDKSKLKEQFKEQQEKLKLEYKKELEDKMNELKAETSKKFKLEQSKIEDFKKEEETKLKIKKEELDKEREKFEAHKQEELKSLEDEKKKYELEYKNLEERIKKELKEKEIELANDRKIMEEKQIQLKQEMDEFIRNEQERLKALNEEELSKEKEHLRILEEKMQQEIELEKDKLIEERKALEYALKEEKLSIEKEKQEFNEKIKLMKEEEERIAERERLVKEYENSTKYVPTSTGDMKVITFVGCKPGTGTSTLAFNTSIALAKKGKKVLYLELNKNYSSMGYIYKLNFYNNGIDIALEQLQSNDYEKVSKNIISLSDVIINTPKDDLMLHNYKKMPDNLKYMFYSGQYYANNKGCTEENFKELIVHLLTMYDFDYIIFDLNIKDVVCVDDKYIFDNATQAVLQLSSKVFFTITQDVSAVGNYMQYKKMLAKSNIPLNNFSFILNKYESKTDLDKKGIEDWIGTKIDLVVPNKSKDAINANYTGLPLIIYSKDRELNKSFESIVGSILQTKNKKHKKGVISFGKE